MILCTRGRGLAFSFVQREEYTRGEQPGPHWGNMQRGPELQGMAFEELKVEWALYQAEKTLEEADSAEALQRHRAAQQARAEFDNKKSRFLQQLATHRNREATFPLPSKRK